MVALGVSLSFVAEETSKPPSDPISMIGSCSSLAGATGFAGGALGDDDGLGDGLGFAVFLLLLLPLLDC